MRRKSRELKMKAVPPLPGAIDQLTVRQRKGNARELENVVERTLIQHKSGLLVFDSETYVLRERSLALLLQVMSHSSWMILSPTISKRFSI